MNKLLLKDAQARIPNVSVFVNTVSKRVRQLQAGHRPYLKPNRGEEAEDVALREIAANKFTVEIDFSAMAREAAAEGR